MNASRKTQYNSDATYQTCGDQDCYDELQSRVDLEDMNSKVYDAIRLLGLSGNKWAENAKKEWNPANPHYAMLHEVEKLKQRITSVLEKAEFAPPWEGKEHPDLAD